MKYSAKHIPVSNLVKNKLSKNTPIKAKNTQKIKVVNDSELVKKSHRKNKTKKHPKTSQIKPTNGGSSKKTLLFAVTQNVIFKYLKSKLKYFTSYR